MPSTFDVARMFAPKAYAPSASKTLLKTRLVKKTIVYLLPPDLSDEEMMAAGLLFMLMGTATSASLESWKSYICSYTCFLLPEIQGRLPAESYAFVALSKAAITPALARVQQYVEVGLVEEENNKMSDTGLLNITLHPDLPAAGAETGYKWCGAEASMKHIYAHYSLIVFLAGKIITPENREALTEKRPAAIIGKCNLDELTLTLNGNLRISDVGHVYINAAWSEMTIFRATCFLEFIQYASMEVNFAQDIIYTSVHLLRYTGLSHARFSYKLIMSNPWVKDFAPLQSSYTTFEDSLRESIKVPALLQPYVKLIFADKSSLFPRKEMEPLVACAVAMEQEMHDSVQQFYRSDKYAAIVDLFLAERQRRSAGGIKKRVTTLAELEEPSDDEYEELAEEPEEEQEEDTIPAEEPKPAP